ncbi:MAG: hypothetical protein LBQ94_02950 [Treponema sp.]|jgi:hypothetical protein|nr:hypothetical protein [Treponema sp.]
MKVFIRAMIGIAIFVCLAFPVFSQSQVTNVDQFNTLSESMNDSISKSTDILALFDSNLNDDGNFKVYSSYRKKYDDLVKALGESEARMSLLYRTNERSEHVKKERDNYNDLLSQLQAVKTEYDAWLRTVR